MQAGLANAKIFSRKEELGVGAGEQGRSSLLNVYDFTDDGKGT